MKENYFKLFKEFGLIVFSFPFHSLIFVAGILVSSVTQMLSLGTLYPIVMYVIQKNSEENKFLSFFRSFLEILHLDFNLLNLLVLFIALSIISNSVFILIQVQQAFFIRNLEVRRRSILINNVINSSWLSLVNLDQGRFLNSSIREVERYRDLIKILFLILANSIQIGMYLGYAIWLAPKLVFISLLVLCFNFLIFFPILKLFFKLSERWTVLMNKANNMIIEIQRGLKFIKSNSHEEHVLISVFQLIRDLARTHFKAHLLGVLQNRLTEVMAFSVFSIILYFSSEVLKIELALLVMILALFYKIIPDIKATLDYAHSSTSLLPASAELNFFNEEYKPEEIKKEKFTLEKIDIISLESVAFKYGDKSVLADFSVNFKKGDFWAITGSSGVGKSTLLDLISGIIKPNTGKIFYNEIIFEELNQWQIHNRIGYMTQDPYIVDGSILENICWGAKNMTEETLAKSVKIAQLDFYDEKETANSNLSPGGANLSGGQKQRISIARIFARDYDFILLDEPTSALDNDTESNFIREISELKGKVGIIMVTHRKEFLKIADNLIVFSDVGEISITKNKK